MGRNLLLPGLSEGRLLGRLLKEGRLNWLLLLWLEGLLGLEGLLRLESLLGLEGLLRLEGWLGLEGLLWLEGLLGLERLLRLEGLLLRNKSRSRLSERRLGRLSEGRCSRLLGLSKELCMRRVSRVNEGVETSAVSTSRHGITIMWGCRLGNLGLCSGNLRSLNWSSLRMNLLRLNSLRLSNRTARELCCIGVVLEVKMCWVSRVDKRIEVSSLLSRLSWLDRGKLSLDRGWLTLNRGWLALDRDWSTLLLPHRRWLCTRCLTSRSRLHYLSSSRIGIKCSRIQSVSSFRNMISLKDSEAILASSVSDSDGFAIIINVTVLSNSFTISGGLFPEH